MWGGAVRLERGDEVAEDEDLRVDLRCCVLPGHSVPWVSFQTRVNVRKKGKQRTCSHCGQYLSRLMLSSLIAALMPPASRKTACHRLRCATCWLSCASACCVSVDAGGRMGRSGCELVDECGVGVRLSVGPFAYEGVGDIPIDGTSV